MNPLDSAILRFDRFLRTVASPAAEASRPLPQPTASAESMSEEEMRHAGGLMRVNHAGEIAAQALYDGQALFARDTQTRQTLERAAQEERDHLAWTSARMDALGTAPSLLSPIWYLGAFIIGASVAAMGDKASATFLRATEQEVETHLTQHLEAMPARDVHSRAVIEAMRADEIAHAQTAERMGGHDLAPPLRMMMRFTAKIMTKVAYRV